MAAEPRWLRTSWWDLRRASRPAEGLRRARAAQVAASTSLEPFLLLKASDVLQPLSPKGSRRIYWYLAFSWRWVTLCLPQYPVSQSGMRGGFVAVAASPRVFPPLPRAGEAGRWRQVWARAPLLRRPSTGTDTLAEGRSRAGWARATRCRRWQCPAQLPAALGWRAGGAARTPNQALAGLGKASLWDRGRCWVCPQEVAAGRGGSLKAHPPVPGSPFGMKVFREAPRGAVVPCPSATAPHPRRGRSHVLALAGSMRNPVSRPRQHLLARWPGQGDRTGGSKGGLPR